MPQPDVVALRKLAAELRQQILRMIAKAGSGHPGGSLSMVELLIGLYWHALRHDPARPDWPDRDVFLLSKGHGCPALYTVLAFRGYFPKDELMTLRRYPTRLQGHPERGSVPGIEMSSGSLGQGLSIANGIAMADRLDGRERRIFCLLGDGEIQEGQVWEAAMTAHHNHLDRVCAIVDDNQLQQNGPVGPLFDEHQPQRIFAIDMHGVRDAAGFPARAADVLKAQSADLVERILARRDAAGDDDHLFPPSTSLSGIAGTG